MPALIWTIPRGPLHCTGLVCVLACLSGTAQGADFPIGLRLRDQNTIELLRQGTTQRSFQASAEGEPVKSVTLGLAYEKDQDGGHSVTTPFLFDYASGSWEFMFSGDGYTWATFGAEHKSGFADLAPFAQYMLPLNSQMALLPGLGFTVPGGSQVGSKHVAQNGQLMLVGTASDRWSWAVGGLIAHEKSSAAGVSDYATSVLGKAKYTWADRSAAVIGFKRGYLRGAGGRSVLLVEYDFAINGSMSGSLSAVHGLTAGSRNNGIELDISF
jgi:hypothetical protein